jgi:ribose transport system ATP-binding protein
LEDHNKVDDRRPALSVRNLVKTFVGMTALEDFSFSVYPGQIHGLIGQNGSGKSTFIKCLAGYHRPDTEWSLQVGSTSIHRPLRAGEVTNYGVSFVHQDLGLLPELSVLENLLLVQFANDHRSFLPWRKERDRFRQILEGFGLDIPLEAPVASLTPVEAAQIAIVRAVTQIGLASMDAGDPHGVLVLDEATTFLDQAGRESMASLLRALKARGFGIIFVSHDLDEVLAICDFVTVLRDGREVHASPVDQVTHTQLVSLITGSQDQVVVANPQRRQSNSTSATEVGLRVGSLQGSQITGVSFEAQRGSITALTGIVGSGWEAVLPLLYGAARATSGVVEIGDRIVQANRMTPRRAIALGMVYVPANRLSEAIVTELSLEENVTLPQLNRHVRNGFLRHAMLRATSQALVDEFAVKATSVTAPIGALSGGNQQKAVLGKWFAQTPSIILLAEPTQGVDVGARETIYEIIREAADRGATVIYASSDWAEVEVLADMVVVLTDGKVGAVLSGADISVDTIATESYRGTPQSFKLEGGIEGLELTLAAGHSHSQGGMA